MIFNEEYDLLKKIAGNDIFKINYPFHQVDVTIYFYSYQDSNEEKCNEFFNVVIESTEESIFLNYSFYFNERNDTALHINGFIPKEVFSNSNLYENIKDSNGKGLTEFYTALKENIRNCNSTNNSICCNHLPKQGGLAEIREKARTSKKYSDHIYFWYTRSGNMSSKQYEKVAKLLGQKIAKKMKQLNNIVVFTDDISKQRKLIVSD